LGPHPSSLPSLPSHALLFHPLPFRNPSPYSIPLLLCPSLLFPHFFPLGLHSFPSPPLLYPTQPLPLIQLGSGERCKRILAIMTPENMSGDNIFSFFLLPVLCRLGSQVPLTYCMGTWPDCALDPPMIRVIVLDKYFTNDKLR